MNVVYENENSKIPMTQAQLTEAFNVFLPAGSKYKNEAYNQKRLDGNLCNCCGNGEFTLLPLDDAGVQYAEKRFMQCRKCGCYSHL